jgi:lipid-binding SYLF domain-containing protein
VGVVIVTEGMGRTLTTTTAKDDVYGFTFGQKGLMAGPGLQGAKITQIDP